MSTRTSRTEKRGRPPTSLSELMEAMPEARRREIERKAREKTAAIRLQRLREERNVTQAELARRLGIARSTLSKLERRSNVTLTTLLQYVEALGGELHIEASFGRKGRRELMSARPRP